MPPSSSTMCSAPTVKGVIEGAMMARNPLRPIQDPEVVGDAVHKMQCLRLVYYIFLLLGTEFKYCEYCNSVVAFLGPLVEPRTKGWAQHGLVLDQSNGNPEVWREETFAQRKTIHMVFLQAMSHLSDWYKEHPQCRSSCIRVAYMASLTYSSSHNVADDTGEIQCVDLGRCLFIFHLLDDRVQDRSDTDSDPLKHVEALIGNIVAGKDNGTSVPQIDSYFFEGGQNNWSDKVHWVVTTFLQATAVMFYQRMSSRQADRPGVKLTRQRRTISYITQTACTMMRGEVTSNALWVATGFPAGVASCLQAVLIVMALSPPGYRCVKEVMADQCNVVALKFEEDYGITVKVVYASTLCGNNDPMDSNPMYIGIGNHVDTYATVRPGAMGGSDTELSVYEGAAAYRKVIVLWLRPPSMVRKGESGYVFNNGSSDIASRMRT